MRILVLSKRQYTNRDLLDDCYGRLRELPLALAAAGNEVAGVCLSYRPRKEGLVQDAQGEARVAWHALNVGRLLPRGGESYWSLIRRIEGDFRPDVVWACSDAWHAMLGAHVAGKLGAALVIDLYDNFESYAATRLPGATTAFRRVLRHAQGITCVSRPLARYVRESASYGGPLEVIENAVPEGVFLPMDRAACRRKLGLPADGFLVGTAGAISASRGIETLFHAFAMLAGENQNIHLVLAGPCDKKTSVPHGQRVHYLGVLPPNEVPVFLSALDVSVVCNRDSAFGRYCFPQKFHESIACGVPTVAAGTEVLRDLLEDSPEHLFEPESAESLTAALRRMMDRPVVPPLTVPTWKTLGVRLEAFLKSCIG